MLNILFFFNQKDQKKKDDYSTEPVQVHQRMSFSKTGYEPVTISQMDLILINVGSVDNPVINIPSKKKKKKK